MPIDLRTVTLIAVVTIGLMAAVQFSVYRGFPRFIHGLGAWALGSAVLCMAGVLLMLRGAVPDWASIVGGNVMLLAGFCLWVVGLQAFYGRQPSHRVLCATVVAGTAGVAWWTLVQPDYMMRLGWMALMLTGLYGVQLALVVRHGERHFNTWLLTLTLAVQTLIVMARCITAFLPQTAEAGLFDITPVQTAYLISYTLTATILTVGLIMAATRRLQTELEQRSSVDPLTGLLNRRAFASVYEQQQAAIAQSGEPIALLLVDLDHFKAVNDAYGHGVGDQVLRDFCRRAASAIPPGTPLARVGGEEFAILLPGADAAHAHAQAEAVRRAMLRPTNTGLPAYTCSIGVVSANGADSTLEALMHAADQALYAAKNDGRNRVKTAHMGAPAVAADAVHFSAMSKEADAALAAR